MVTADVLEHMKHRLADAHRRLQEATQRLQQAQQEHQAAAQEFSIWQGALQIEQKKQAQANAVPAQAVTANAPTPAQEQKVVASTEPTVSASEINKTEAIRELLAKNSTGMTPAEIWSALKGQVDRAYVYSVLKRLKDKKRVATRRGKYYLNISAKPEEEIKQQTLLQ